MRRVLSRSFLCVSVENLFSFSRRDLRGAEILRTLPPATVEYRNSQPRPRLRHNPADNGGVDVTIREEGGLILSINHEVRRRSESPVF